MTQGAPRALFPLGAGRAAAAVMACVGRVHHILVATALRAHRRFLRAQQTPTASRRPSTTRWRPGIELHAAEHARGVSQSPAAHFRGAGFPRPSAKVRARHRGGRSRQRVGDGFVLPLLSTRRPTSCCSLTENRRGIRVIIGAVVARRIGRAGDVLARLRPDRPAPTTCSSRCTACARSGGVRQPQISD